MGERGGEREGVRCLLLLTDADSIKDGRGSTARNPFECVFPITGEGVIMGVTAMGASVAPEVEDREAPTAGHLDDPGVGDLESPPTGDWEDSSAEPQGSSAAEAWEPAAKESRLVSSTEDREVPETET